MLVAVKAAQERSVEYLMTSKTVIKQLSNPDFYVCGGSGVVNVVYAIPNFGQQG